MLLVDDKVGNGRFQLQSSSGSDGAAADMDLNAHIVDLSHITDLLGFGDAAGVAQIGLDHGEGAVLEELPEAPTSVAALTRCQRQVAFLLNVAVVDERSEIAGCYMGISQRDLGSFCDVLDGCKKADGVRMMIRSMAPQVVAVDEIGTSEDIAALSYALTSGCSLLATIHGETLSQVRQKKEFQAVFENKMFERYILLDNLFHPGKCLAVYDKEGKTIWK